MASWPPPGLGFGFSILVDDLGNELVDAGILDAIETHDTPKLFDWIVPAFSYQGIADAIDQGRTACQAANRVNEFQRVGPALALPGQSPGLLGRAR
jgi:hypothetical protein